MSKPPKSGKVAAGPVVPVVEQPRPVAKKLKLVPLADIDVTQVQGILDEHVEVPYMTEDRLYEIERALEIETRIIRPAPVAMAHYSASAEAALRGGMKLPLMQVPCSVPTPQAKKIAKALNALPVLERNFLRLSAFYRVVHGNTLRVHEELSRNLGINIGDLVVVERKLSAKLALESPDIHAGISPVGILVMFLYFLGEEELNTLLRSSPHVVLAGTAGSSQVLRALLAKKVRDFVVHRASVSGITAASNHDGDDDSTSQKGAAAPKENFSRGHKALSDFRHAMQNNASDYILNKWVGTACVFMASIDWIAKNVAAPNPPPNADALGRLSLRSTITFPNAEDAMAGFSSLLTTQLYEGAAMSLPALLPFTSSEACVPRKPTVALRRKADYVAPALDVAEDGVPRTWEQRLAIMCDGWHLSLTPQAVDPLAVSVAQTAAEKTPRPASRDSSTRPSSKSSKKESFTRDMEVQYVNSIPTYITVEVVVPGVGAGASNGRLAAVYPYDITKNEESYVFSPMAQFSITSFLPDQLKLVMTLATDPPVRADAIAVQYAAFIERVLGDSKKASVASSKIYSRLMSQFVPPHHCHRHPDQRYAFFCAPCRKFICACCAQQTHSGHTTDPISSFCMNEAIRLEPKALSLVHRVNSLRQILATVDKNTERMKQLVDMSIDDVLGRINNRRTLLHSDAEDRAKVEVKLLKQECVALDGAEDRVNHAKGIVAEIGRGRVSLIPRVKPLLSRQVLDQLSPRLPTEHLKRLVRVLTWSNPSKYLTQFIYPPAPLDLSKVKTMVPMALQASGATAAVATADGAHAATTVV